MLTIDSIRVAAIGLLLVLGLSGCGLARIELMGGTSRLDGVIVQAFAPASLADAAQPDLRLFTALRASPSASSVPVRLRLTQERADLLVAETRFPDRTVISRHPVEDEGTHLELRRWLRLWVVPPFLVSHHHMTVGLCRVDDRLMVRVNSDSAAFFIGFAAGSSRGESMTLLPIVSGTASSLR